MECSVPSSLQAGVAHSPHTAAQRPIAISSRPSRPIGPPSTVKKVGEFQDTCRLCKRMRATYLPAVPVHLTDTLTRTDLPPSHMPERIISLPRQEKPSPSPDKLKKVNHHMHDPPSSPHLL